MHCRVLPLQCYGCLIHALYNCSITCARILINLKSDVLFTFMHDAACMLRMVLIIKKNLLQCISIQGRRKLSTVGRALETINTLGSKTVVC